jgi:2',3'-cyclic-nucleotide 2'-phosphodiesterase (5'-nucleotidase family)
MRFFKNLKYYSAFTGMLLVFGCTTDKSFEILYFSNLNGNIEACHCYDVMLGGLHQIKPVVDKLRKENPNLILIDGGDTFNTYSFIELDQAIADAYKLIKPDIWVPGEQEFIEGKPFFKNLVDSMETTLLAGNIEINDLPLQKTKTYTFQNKKIIITSYIQPDVYEGMDSTLQITVNDKPNEKLNSEYFKVLIFHGDEAELNRQDKLVSAFDLVLSAHQQSPDIDLDSDTPVIGGGADGEFLVHIILQNNKSGFKISASKINIEQSDNPDKQIAKIISEYRDKIGLTD